MTILEGLLSALICGGQKKEANVAMSLQQSTLGSTLGSFILVRSIQISVPYYSCSIFFHAMLPYTAPEDPCSSKPCQNKGQCTSNLLMNSYRCQCTDGYSGRNCQNRMFCSDLHFFLVLYSLICEHFHLGHNDNVAI